MNVAILGLGTIGSGVYEIISSDKELIQQKTGLSLQVTRVLDLRDFSGTPVEAIWTKDFGDIENDDSVDVVVETMGGTRPAYDFVKACILKGKHVVTSNKALVAAHGTELLQLAVEKGVHFLFEASVGGAIPVIRVLTSCMCGDEPVKITGILNGTTNYILTEMLEKGVSFEDALKDAQALGYAERDPSADVEGFDTCRKIAILASIMTGKFVNYEDIPTTGITGVSIEEMHKAAAEGKAVKLLARAEKTAEGLKLSVGPETVSKEDELYAVHGVFNAVLIEGSNSGKLMYYGSGAGKMPTASAVVADICHTADPVPSKPLWTE